MECKPLEVRDSGLLILFRTESYLKKVLKYLLTKSSIIIVKLEGNTKYIYCIKIRYTVYLKERLGQCCQRHVERGYRQFQDVLVGN